MEWLPEGGWSLVVSSLLIVVASSKVLHHCPTLLHRRRTRELKKDPRFQATHIAHRGCRLEGIPENTLAAFNHAIEHTAHVLEFDVWLTRDGKVVVFHDADLERMTGVKGRIADCAYSELPSIRLDPEEHWGVTDENRRLATRIPLLSEVLEVIPPELPIIIEFKQCHKSLVEQVHSMIHATERQERVIWFSLQQSINVSLRAHDPSIPNITSVAGMLKVIMLYYSGLLPFFRIEEDIMGVPVDEVDYARVRGNSAFKGLPDFVCYALAAVLGGKPPKALIPPGLFAHLRKRGIPVFFLGVNDEADIQVAIEAGATAVLTDKPRWLNERITEGRVALPRLPAY